MEPNPNLWLDLPVGTLMAHWPQLIPIFWKYRMLCIGCSLAAFDTLAQALDEHHIPVQPFLDECKIAVGQLPYKLPIRKENHGF